MTQSKILSKSLQFRSLYYTVESGLRTLIICSERLGFTGFVIVFTELNKAKNVSPINRDLRF